MKHIEIYKNGQAETVRVTIKVGNTSMGFNVAKEPTNKEEWIELLKGLIVSFEAQEVEDKEVLGEYSP